MTESSQLTRRSGVLDQPMLDREQVARVLAAVVESSYCMFGAGFAPGVRINDRCPVDAIDPARLDKVMERLR